MADYYDWSDDESITRVRVARHVMPKARPAPTAPVARPVKTVKTVKTVPQPAPQAAAFWAAPAQAPMQVFVQNQPPAASQPVIRLSRSRSRSRSRERRSPPHAAPVVVHNNIINEHSDTDSDYHYYSDASRAQHRRRPHGGRHSRNHSHARAHSRDSRSSSHSMTLEEARERWELEQARDRLRSLQLANHREAEERRLDKQYREEAELREAKAELDEIKRNEAKQREEARIKREMELAKLEEEKRQAARKRELEEEHRKAVERYKADQAEKAARDKADKERADKEFERRLMEKLLASGVDEKDIESIIKNKKIERNKAEQKPAAPPPQPQPQTQPQKQQQPQPQPPPVVPVVRPTYTRMSLRHLEIDSLIQYKMDWEYDQDPDYVLIKRWVPEHEQHALWEHTRQIRLRLVERPRRGDKLVVQIEGKKHENPRLEWVRVKKDRRRSKSPGLLMYLAGGRP